MPCTLIIERTGEPLYLQIANQIRQQIATGQISIGERLPTIRQMSEDLRINSDPIRHALRLLQTEHIIDIVQGSGTFVTSIPAPSDTNTPVRRMAEKIIAQCKVQHIPIQDLIQELSKTERTDTG